MRTLAALFCLLTAACGGPSSTRPPSSSSSVAPSPASGRPAIQGRDGAIALETAEGRPTTLASVGKPVTVIALWASYCRPCIDELPYVDALYRAQRDRADVAVVAVNIDDRDDPAMRRRVDAIERQLGLGLPRLYRGEKLMERVAPRDADGGPRLLLPMLVVVDSEFRIHYRLGFARGEPLAEYLADKDALIAAARRGNPPAREDAPRAPVDNIFKLKLPRMDEAELRVFVPQFRAQMAQVFPHLDAATLDDLAARARTAARIGGDLEVDLSQIVPPPEASPPPAAPAR